MSENFVSAEAKRKEAQEIHHRWLQLLLEKDIHQWMELWDENAVMEFPYAPNGYTRQLQGKSEIYDYMKDFPSKIDLFRFTEPQVHQTLNPNVMIVEFGCEGRMLSTGKPYNQSYISVIETENGKITRYKDYWNPLVAIEAIGGLESFMQTFNRS